MPSNFFRRILRSEAIINTIISHAAAYSSIAGHVVTNEKEEKYSYLGIHFSSNGNQNLKEKARRNIWGGKTSDTGQPDLH